jgi:pyruvate-formate lyase-activating enzyme
MARACCAKPITRIIKIAEFEAGILGLDQALRNVYISGLADEEEIQRELLKWIKEFGNYITPLRENDYRKALLREYREYLLNVKREERQQSDRSQKR